MEKYKIIAVEQDFRSVWSQHSTIELARKAARLYDRKNNFPPSPFEIIHPDGTVEFSRNAGN